MLEPPSVAATLVLVARLVLSGFFLPSAIGKLRDLPGFIQGTIDYRVLPEQAARRFALVLPWAELALALALLGGVALPLAGAASLLLLLCFIAAVTINLRRGRQIACNCHGVAGTRTISWGTVARNLLLVLLTLPLIGLAPASLELTSWIAQWQADLRLLSTLSAALVVGLLLAFCAVTIQLIEWAVDLQMRIARLRSR